MLVSESLDAATTATLEKEVFSTTGSSEVKLHASYFFLRSFSSGSSARKC